MDRVTDQTRNDVWQGLLDADRLVRYYQAMADRYKRYALWTRLFLVGSATGGIAAFLGLLPDYGQVVAGAMIALVVVIDLVIDFQRKAAELHAIRTDLGRIEIEWQDLWGRVESIDEEQARDRVAALLHETNATAARGGGIGIRVDRRLNVACTEETYRVIGAQYGSAN